jgi:hypothetical protein
LSSDSARRFAGTWDSRVSARDNDDDDDDAHRDRDDDDDDDDGGRRRDEVVEAARGGAGAATKMEADLRDRDPTGAATRRTREGFSIIVVVVVVVFVSLLFWVMMMGGEVFCFLIIHTRKNSIVQIFSLSALAGMRLASRIRWLSSSYNMCRSALLPNGS